MSTFHLEIVTPTLVLAEGEVGYVRCPGTDGAFGVMAGHQEAIFALDVGEIKVLKGAKETYYSTSGGFVEIAKEKVQILVETVEKSEEIDVSRAGASLERAKSRKTESDPDVDETRVEVALKRALNRLRVAKR